MRILMSCLLLSAVVWAGCDVSINGVDLTSKLVKGSGVSATETREVDSFKSINISGIGKLEITQGNEFSVVVTTDENLQPLIVTVVENDELKIYSSESISPSSDVGLQIAVVMPRVENLKMSGACNGTLKEIDADSLGVKVSGVAKIVGAGKVDSLDLKTNGASSINTSDLVAKTLVVDVSGAGKASVHATEKATVKVSGAGKVTVYGNPPILDKSVSGVGKVVKAKE